MKLLKIIAFFTISFLLAATLKATYHHAAVKLNGKHAIRIEQVENAGYATLIFKIKPINTKQ